MNFPITTPKFPRSLILEKTGDMMWTIYEDFEYYVGDPKNNDLIVIPKGFQTDLASVPRIFWTFFPPDGKYTYACLPHDFLYWVQTRSRAATDRIFLEALKEVGMGWFTRHLMYAAVRAGGWLPWNQRAKQKKGPDHDDDQNISDFRLAFI